jgi:hypothetical protein
MTVLHLVLYGRVTSPHLVGKQRLSVFDNRFMRKIFGTWRAEITGQWRGMQDEGFHNYWSGQNKKHESGEEYSTYANRVHIGLGA